ncbi:MAG: hypothetical protein MUF33_04065 [Candidatus Nanopelagicales bacterium]|jgi:hypothetical protein|nr:hypothetical protein [Candidatus Nanopelagicales bacterium]
MDDRTPDLDSIIEAAWKDYRARLATAFDVLEDGGSFTVEFDLEGITPYVQVLRVDNEILLEASGNPVLDDGWVLDEADRTRLCDLGFEKPGDDMPNYWVRLPVTHVDQAASMAVRAMREAFHVMHPSALTSDHVDWPCEPFPPTPEAEPVVQPPVTYPQSREQLQELIDRALAEVMNQVPHRDSDGDVPIRTGRCVVFVRAFEDRPMIRLFAIVANDVTDRDAALGEVNRLNRATEGIKFLLQGSTVIAAAELLGWPFAQSQFLALVRHMCDSVAEHEDDLVDQVGGRHFLDEAPAGEAVEESIHPAMLSILQLDADSPGSLRPKDAAKICDNDPDLLLELIRWNEEQEIEWRKARDETDDPDEERVCELERKHAHGTVKLLRKALRKVLLG